MKEGAKSFSKPAGAAGWRALEFGVRVPDPRKADVTGLLVAWRQGDQRALDELMPLVLAELRNLARRYMANEPPGHVLQATALVNEAYLRLIDLKHIKWRDRAHFFAMAATMMRRILVDEARERRAQRRGGGAAFVTFDEALPVSNEQSPDVIALDDALEALAREDERKSRVVELRYFGGLTVKEIAEVLDLSEDTITRDWNFAKTWLLRNLTRRQDG